MLYLIRTFGRGKTAIKVGFTDDPGKRLNNYRIDNPFFELIAVREGDRTEETRAHLYLTSCGLKESFLNEWFLDSQKTILGFHNNKMKMNKSIWRNRDTLFVESDFKRGGNEIKKKIYEQLRELFGESSNSTADKAWLREQNLELLKEMRKERKTAEKRYK